MPEHSPIAAGDPPRRGLSCTVLRPADGADPTNGGMSDAVACVVLTDPFGLVGCCSGDALQEPGTCAPQPDPAGPAFRPELQLRERRGFLIACPPDAGPKGEPYAFGGNWIWSASERFPEPAPIAVHDRALRLEEVDSGVPRHSVTNLPVSPAAVAEDGRR